MMLSLHDDEGRMLGVHTQHLRLLILLIATLATSGIISMTGLISFISLLAPHGARLIIKNNRLSTMFLSGIIGGCLLTLGDILARSVASTELPVSIFTSLVGAPFLVYLCVRRNRESRVCSQSVTSLPDMAEKKSYTISALRSVLEQSPVFSVQMDAANLLF